MNTNDLVSMLATGIEATDRHAFGQRFLQALALAVPATLLLFFTAYGVRADIGAMLALPLFWLKFGFALPVLAAAGWLTLRLARPGSTGTAGWVMAALPVLALWAAAAFAVAEADPGERARLLLGHSWRSCTASVALLSVPVFAGLLWALRGMLPTVPVQAGAAAGLAAGAFALFLYSLFCTEMALPFWSVWYVLGMLLPCGAGALAGALLLRW
jgi:hypothetical protein